MHLAPPSGVVQRALSTEPEGKSAALAAGTHDGRDAAASPVAIAAPAQHRMDTFAVLCSDVFETRADMAEAADEGVQHISENPLFMLSRVTDDAPMPAAGLITVQTPHFITPCTAATDVRQEFTQSPVPHMKGTHETDVHGKYMSDTHERATSDDITESASATDADGLPSPEPSAKGDMQAADDGDDESVHQETLRGQQAQRIAKRIRESWAALRQEQQATMGDGSVQQEMQPAFVQGRIGFGYDGRGPSMKALAQRGAPGRLQAHEADSEDMTDVIYANWGSVAGAPDNQSKPTAMGLEMNTLTSTVFLEEIHKVIACMARHIISVKSGVSSWIVVRYASFAWQGCSARMANGATRTCHRDARSWRGH